MPAAFAAGAIIAEMVIRAIGTEEWEDFRVLRLRALADAPDAFRTTREEALARSDEEWIEMVRAAADDPDAAIWIVERDGVAVGQAYTNREGSRLDIYGMWVAPEARGEGVGRALLGTAESWGRDSGCATAYLSVTEGNSPAQQLYESAGYRPTGLDAPLREGSPLSCVELSKEL